MRGAVGRIGGRPPAEQRGIVRDVVEGMNLNILPHTAWAEQVLYPFLDGRVGGSEPFTATLRFEHGVVRRWTTELAAERVARQPDIERFARRAENLVGLLEAHFDAEEAVLYTLLDRTMTAEEVERELRAAQPAPA
jgi:hemerythrin-like domain-containing protein